MSEKSETQTLPPHVGAALDEIVHYLWEDEKQNYHSASRRERRRHIFRHLAVLSR